MMLGNIDMVPPPSDQLQLRASELYEHTKGGGLLTRMKDVLNIYFHVKNKLESAPELRRFLYHGWMHTKSFYDAVCYLAPLEGIGDNDFEKLKIASLYHDTGYTTGIAEDHEYQSAVIAHQELSSFGVDKCDIDDICKLILSTIPNTIPVGIFEEIMHDADYEYIGRDYYTYVVELLRRERGILHSVWKREQIAFLERHKFITSSAQKIFNRQKEINIKKLKDSM
jgi:uncharacterized protein